MKILIFGHHPDAFSGLAKVCRTIEKILLKNDILFTHIATDAKHLPPRQFENGSAVASYDYVKTQLNNLAKAHDLVLTIGDIWSYEFCCELVKFNKIPWIAYFGVEGQTYPVHLQLPTPENEFVDLNVLMSYITGVWTYTDHSKKILSDILPEKQIDILPHFADVKRIRDVMPFGIRKKIDMPDKKLALFIGDNTHRKGIDLICKWLSGNDDYIVYLHTQRYRPTVGFDIEELKYINKLDGKLFYKDDLKKFLKENTLSELELYGLYKDCDLFLHPHRAEGFGLCILEALCAKVPVLATDTAGPSTYLPKNCKIETWQNYYQKHGGVGYEVQEPSLIDMKKKIEKGKGKHDFQPVGFDISDFEKNLLGLLDKKYEARKFFKA